MYTYARADAHTTQAHLLAWVNLQVMRPLFCACVRIFLFYYFLKLCTLMNELRVPATLTLLVIQCRTATKETTIVMSPGHALRGVFLYSCY